MRVTWVQPEDLVGHELRQAQEEGKDVDAIEARWHAAGGEDAPSRGASQTAAPPELRALALRLLDELADLPRPLAEAEPEELEAILASAEGEPPCATVTRELDDRLAGAWLGRAAGCLLGKPVEGLPREGIRELLESSGRWPLDGYFTAAGVPDDVSERWPWNRASRSTSLAESIDGMPEDDDLNFTLLALALLERAGPGFSSLDVAKHWLDYLPPGRIFTAERIACRNLLLAFLPPETATHRNPFREWIGARLRVDVYGWAAAGDSLRAARMAWEDARVSHTANGVYAAMWMAAAHAVSLGEASSSDAADAGLTVIPTGSRLAVAIREAGELARARDDWEAVVDGLHERFGALHWVHAISNTALVAAALYFFDDFDSAVCGVVQAGWDTDTNGAAVGSIFGGLSGRSGLSTSWTEPLKNRIASSLPGFDGVAIDELARRTLVGVSAPAAV